MDRDPQGQEDAASRVAVMRDLARLWVQSQPAVSAYIAASVYDIHHAEDLVQEVAQVVAEKFTDYDHSLSFTSWALGIARHRLLKYYRSRARDRLVLSEAALNRLGESLERVEHEAEDRRVALRKCLERVTGRRREVLEMRYSANVRVADIASHFGMSPDGVSVMLHRIRAVLFGCIQQQLATRDAQ
jgi:RNA polymerase sigma-70 factor, ECF subfamily